MLVFRWLVSLLQVQVTAANSCTTNCAIMPVCKVHVSLHALQDMDMVTKTQAEEEAYCYCRSFRTAACCAETTSGG